MSKEVIKPAKHLAKSTTASGKAPNPKRPNSDMSLNSTAEEISLMSAQMDTLTDDMKTVRENLKGIMRKDEMETFIEQTVTKIINDLNENMEVTIAIKVTEKKRAA